MVGVVEVDERESPEKEEKKTEDTTKISALRGHQKLWDLVKNILGL